MVATTFHVITRKFGLLVESIGHLDLIVLSIQDLDALCEVVNIFM